MALTRSFRETVLERAKRDPEFKIALIQEALEALTDGDSATATSLLRDVINATIGFHALSEATGIPEKSLMRMVGPHGNPRMDNMGRVIRALIMGNHVRVRVHAELEKEPA